ncbi:Uncharacterised protein [Candidatus Gugararchaeum adminiculabundum]|nr:Uncharacterised protein [Candidatus Gugararchaeum adminiculabundum]
MSKVKLPSGSTLPPTNMRYEVRIVSLDEKDRVLAKVLAGKKLWRKKALLHECSIQIITDEKNYAYWFDENFFLADEKLMAHGIIFSIENGGDFEVLYEPYSRALIVLNCDYYGWVKSMALALAADILEDYASNNRRFSVHGSAVDYSGRGLAIIAPSGTGKTTLTYGLLMEKRANYIADDWFFVRAFANGMIGYSSEKNSYIREDLPRVWPEYSSLAKDVELDNKMRGVADLSNLFGSGKIRHETTLSKLVLLMRDKSEERKFWKMTSDEAFAYLKKIYYGNPQHQLIRDARKIKLRDEFFKQFVTRLETYMLNTTETPAESLGRLKELADGM